ncbi:MAG: redox-sensing transcriptional repressor Rex [Acholeplasmatales bacterium]|jgi:redox-sensing transcriptional repressor|nr:redox-sensing transcriptional repressor Rex [Acholeplasmatales bacterium]
MKNMNFSHQFNQDIPKPMLTRIPQYLTYLKSLSVDIKYINSAKIAEALNLGVVQVRKDLAFISKEGRPKLGYELLTLINKLESFLGYHQIENTVLVGVGQLGSALYNYSGFQEYGLKIIAIFDTPEKIKVSGLPIKAMDKLPDIIKQYQVQVGMIATTTEAAQEVCNQMVVSGIKGILNFASLHLVTPADVIVKNMNIATTLSLLVKEIKEKDGRK